MNIDFDDLEQHNLNPNANKTVETGRDQKGDLLINMHTTENQGIVINLASSVKTLFGREIENLVRSTLEQLAVTHIIVDIKDHGALNFAIEARVEAAARQLYIIPGHTMLPTRPIETPKLRDRLRRTRLYLPGNNPDFMLNAGLFGADCLVLDLEDSVTPHEKLAARFLVRNALAALDFGRSERIVRINPLSTAYGSADLDAIVPACPDAILIPKCETTGDVTDVEQLLSALEQKHNLHEPIQLMPLIETAKGVLNAVSIAKASHRTVALCFGAEDFAADMGIERSRDGKENFLARSIVCMAARAAQISSLDSVYSDIEDIVGLQAATSESIQMGFDGRGAIHPGQIKPIHDAFMPTPQQIEYSRQVITAYDQAQASGSGVAALGTKMIDAPVVIRAKKILAMAEKMTNGQRNY